MLKDAITDGNLRASHVLYQRGTELLSFKIPKKFSRIVLNGPALRRCPFLCQPTIAHSGMGFLSKIITVNREVRSIKRWLSPFVQLIVVVRAGRRFPKEGVHYLGQTTGVL